MIVRVPKYLSCPYSEMHDRGLRLAKYWICMPWATPQRKFSKPVCLQLQHLWGAKYCLLQWGAFDSCSVYVCYIEKWALLSRDALMMKKALPVSLFFSSNWSNFCLYSCLCSADAASGSKLSLLQSSARTSALDAALSNRPLETSSLSRALQKLETVSKDLLR